MTRCDAENCWQARPDSRARQSSLTQPTHRPWPATRPQASKNSCTDGREDPIPVDALREAIAVKRKESRPRVTTS